MFRTILITLLCFAPSAFSLTLEEKIGQLLMVSFTGEEANGEAWQLIEQIKVGGFIYFNKNNGLHNPEQVKTLSHGLQAMAQNANILPLFIAVDQEGGRVARLKKGFRSIPSARELAQRLSPQEVSGEFYLVGTELSSVGINLNLAPVVDIDSNPQNPVIGNRSFGTNSSAVIQFASACQQGLHQAGILTCLKHFPGHGDTSKDSHVTLPVVHKTKAELMALELAPYFAMHSTSPFIMTAHVLYPQLDPKNCATLSYPIIMGILRNEMGFSGIILTDSLMMKGVLPSTDDLSEIALRAFEAGHDILLLGSSGSQLEPTLKVHEAFMEAVRNGRISEQQIDRSVEKIIDLKRKSATQGDL